MTQPISPAQQTVNNEFRERLGILETKIAYNTMMDEADNGDTSTKIAALVAYDQAQTAVNASQSAMNSDVSTKINALQQFDAMQAVINTNQTATNNAQTSTNTSVASRLTALEAFDTAQTATNNTIATKLTTLTAFDTAQTTTNTTVAGQIAALQSFDQLQATINTNQTATNTAQTTTNTNVGNRLTAVETFNNTQSTTNISVANRLTAVEAFDTAQTATNASVQTALGTKASQADLVALTARVAALEAKRISVGSAATPAIALGGTVTVPVTITPTMADTNYLAVAVLRGGTGLLGQVVVRGVASQTTTTVNVTLAASLLTVAGAGTVDVIAVHA